VGLTQRQLNGPENGNFANKKDATAASFYTLINQLEWLT
jgi:hypothetical protein